MVMRRQTWLLLVVLVGAVVAAALYQPSHQTRERSGLLTYRQASGNERAAAYAAIRVPRGFHRSQDCWQPLEPGGFCLVRVPSVPPSADLLSRWSSEAGFSLAVKPSSYEKESQCIGGRREGLTLSACTGVGLIGGQLFIVGATSAVVVRHGRAQGTTALVGRRNRKHGHIRGTQLHFIDAGFPAPEAGG